MVISFKEANKSWLVPAYFLPPTISFIFFEEENKELILVGSYLILVGSYLILAGSYLYWLVPTYILPQSILWLFYLRKEISVGPGLFPSSVNTGHFLLRRKYQMVPAYLILSL